MNEADKLKIASQLLDILGSEPIKHKRKKRGSNCCAVCGKRYSLERHHVTYDPPKIVKLCHVHHKKITELNTEVVIMICSCRRKLTNKERLKIWDRFLKENKK